MEPNCSPFEVSCAANEPNSDAEDAEEVKDKLVSTKHVNLCLHVLVKKLC